MTFVIAFMKRSTTVVANEFVNDNGLFYQEFNHEKETKWNHLIDTTLQC